MADYVLVETVKWSMETAELLDAGIAQRFPSAPKGRVLARWTLYLAFVKKAARARMLQIEDEKRKDSCGGPPPKTKRSSTSYGRYSAAFDLDFDNLTPESMATFRRSLLSAADPVERGWSRWEGSSLERRVPKTPRSGAKAPAGAACPLKNPPPKKVVPKSQAKTRPKPARKPRQPARRPAPRQPARKKQVAKRPAVRFLHLFNQLSQLKVYCRAVPAVSLASRLLASVLPPSVGPSLCPSQPAARRASRVLARPAVGEQLSQLFSICVLLLVAQ